MFGDTYLYLTWGCKICCFGFVQIFCVGGDLELHLLLLLLIFKQGKRGRYQLGQDEGEAHCSSLILMWIGRSLCQCKDEQYVRQGESSLWQPGELWEI